MLQIYNNFSIFKDMDVKNFLLDCARSVFFVPLYSIDILG